MRARIMAAIVLMAMTTGGAFAQTVRRPAQKPLEEGTSVIAGTVIDAQSKQPLPGVEITVSMLLTGGNRGGSPGGVLTTDREGRYAFAGIAEGSYVLTARMPDYLSGCYVSTD